MERGRHGAEAQEQSKTKTSEGHALHRGARRREKCDDALTDAQPQQSWVTRFCGGEDSRVALICWRAVDAGLVSPARADTWQAGERARAARCVDAPGQSTEVAVDV